MPLPLPNKLPIFEKVCFTVRLRCGNVRGIERSFPENVVARGTDDGTEFAVESLVM